MGSCAAPILAVAILSGCAGLSGNALEPKAPAPSDYTALITATDRTEADRKTDARRDPTKLLAVTGVRPGMRVLDMGTGGGYSTELMARAVGPTGTVVGQDAPDSNERGRQNFAARAQGAAMKNVVRSLRPFADPLPPGTAPLDLITFFFTYHDTVHLGVDRAAMNRGMFAALKPGGALVIADHHAKIGDGANVTRTLHRIEESVVRRELEAAGFQFVGSVDFLRQPSDPREVRVFDMKTPVDEFVLKFVKPR